MYAIKKMTRDGWVEIARGTDYDLMEKARKALDKATTYNLILVEVKREVSFGPLSKAYDVNSLKYKLAYHSFNVLSSILAGDKNEAKVLAESLGVSEDEMFSALEDLFTENADPDALEKNEEENV